MEWELILKVYPYLLKAGWVTVELSVLTTLLGLVCGALGVSARLSRFSRSCASSAPPM